jgi:hypothetical protein
MKQIINCETGEIIERELNKEELAQVVIDTKMIAEIKAAIEIKAEAKASAQAKLTALGLTIEDLQALGL